jgi:hypothetical protein
MSAAPPWEAYLTERFPGYLLPESLGRALPEEVARRFLERIGGDARHLALLRATSVLSARAADVRALCLVHLPDLRRRPLARAEARRRTRRGELRGRLDAAATLERRMTGRIVEIVAREPVPPAHPPEDVLLAAVTRRLLRAICELEAAGVLGRSGWSAALAPCEQALLRALSSPPLAGVPEAPLTAHHEDAARLAPHPAHRLALALHRALRRGLDARDPVLVARAVAEGALVPLAAHTRFEVAVLLRLLQVLEERPGWSLSRTLVLKGRREVAELEGPGGAFVQVYYDQAVLPPGPYDAGLRRYLGRRGRLRPDITLVAGAPGRASRATLIEVKLSTDPGYLAEGYREAIVYAAEYGAALAPWPKAILVTAAPVAEPPRREDEVIAVGWDRWVPAEVTDALFEGLAA